MRDGRVGGGWRWVMSGRAGADEGWGGNVERGKSGVCYGSLVERARGKRVGGKG